MWRAQGVFVLTLLRKSEIWYRKISRKETKEIWESLWEKSARWLQGQIFYPPFLQWILNYKIHDSPLEHTIWMLFTRLVRTTSSTDSVITGCPWMFLWITKVRVKRLKSSTWPKTPSPKRSWGFRNREWPKSTLERFSSNKTHMGD